MFRFLRRKSAERKAFEQAAEKSMYLDYTRGAMVSAWAFIESCIDQANHFAWQFTEGKIQKFVPVSFNRKVALFKKLHVDLPLYRPLRDQAAHILARLETRKEDRHYLVHGFCEPDESELWTLTKHVFSEDGSIGIVQRRFDIDELDELVDDVLDIQKEMGRYTDALIAEIDKHKAHNRRG